MKQVFIYYKIKDIMNDTITINNINYVRISVIVPKDIQVDLFINEECVSNVAIGHYYKSDDLIHNSCPTDNCYISASYLLINDLEEVSKYRYNKQSSTLIGYGNFRYSKHLPLKQKVTRLSSIRLQTD